MIYARNDTVRYKNMIGKLLWFNPMEREWMMRTEDGSIVFVREIELEMVFPDDAMNKPEVTT